MMPVTIMCFFLSASCQLHSFMEIYVHKVLQLSNLVPWHRKDFCNYCYFYHCILQWQKCIIKLCHINVATYLKSYCTVVIVVDGKKEVDIENNKMICEFLRNFFVSWNQGFEFVFQKANNFLLLDMHTYICVLGMGKKC